MIDANKYSFSNVLVADTKLHVNLSESGARQPSVLVLNTKLVTTNKCHKLSSCACCLRVERPEFRKRSSIAVAEPAPECFASCHDRRTMSIELRAQAQLSGKLIILALSRAENLFKGTPKIPFKCHMQTTWSFTRFEPGAHLSSETGQVYYSRLDQSQVPSLLIDTLEFQWNPIEHKEVISLAIQSNIHRTHKHQVSMKETLLVAELNCHPLVGNVFENDVEGQFVGSSRQVHIMTLINREIHPSVSTQQNASSRSSSINQRSTAKSRLPELQPPTHTPPGQNGPSIQQNRRAIASQTSATGVYPKITTKREEQPFVDIISVRPAQATTASPALQRKVELRNNDQAQMGPPYFADDEALRLKLRSSGLVVITVSSLLVILTYTLCLLFYLKLRNRIRSRGSMKDTVATLDSHQPPVLQVFKAPEVMDISEPFNLRMGGATRTRLEMMLGRRRSKQPRQTKKMTKKSGLSPELARYNEQPNTNNNFGSMRVVRAIRHAATLARSRLKGSHSRIRYRPNLHVIPESELEQQQSPRKELGLYANFANQQATLINRNNCVSPEQLETLVQDAMSPNCSHTKEKNLHQHQNATLFARPNDDDLATDDLVSRSRILKQIKQDDLCEEYMRKTAR